jgi:hypothetical protein
MRPGDSVDLFTSGAGSSCPPAEANVGEFAQHPLVQALMFRLDYWDDLGWSDRLGLSESMKRQRTYTRSRRLRGTSPPASDERKSLIGNHQASIGRDWATRSGASVKLPTSGGDWRPHRLVAERHRTPDHRIQHRAVIAHNEQMHWRIKRVVGRRSLLDDAPDEAIPSLSPASLTGGASLSRIRWLLRVLPTVALHAPNNTMVASHAHRHRRRAALWC